MENSINAGTYEAKPTGAVVIREHANGCLILEMEFQIEETGERISNTFWLTRKDGGVNGMAIKTLKEAFGWDGVNPWWFDGREEIKGMPVSLIIDEEAWIGADGIERRQMKIKYINPSKTSDDPTEFLKRKYGSLFTKRAEKQVEKKILSTEDIPF